jgi:hypothetical protein
LQKTSESDKRLKSSYKKFLKLSNKGNNPIKKWAKDLNRHLTKEDIQMANEHMERLSVSNVIREMQNKTIQYHYMPRRKAEIQNTDTWQECGATELSSVAGEL